MACLLAASLQAHSQTPQPKPANSPEQKAVAQINAYRAQAGLPPIQLDEKQSIGCMAHARYMVLNRDSEALAGLNLHTERPDIPGYTPDGASCAQSADLAPSISSLSVAIDEFMASLYHRRPILNPGLGSIAIGYAPLPDGSIAAAIMFINKDFFEPRAVFYPADGQSNVPLAFGKEFPDPVPPEGGGGYPIRLQFLAFDTVTSVHATLTDAAGHDVPFSLSDPEHPATSFPQYGVVCLIPKETLLPGSSYHASVDAKWRGAPVHKEVRFSTLTPRPVEAADEAALEQAIGVPSLVRGVIGAGGTMEDGEIFLMIGNENPVRFASISIHMSPALWTALGGGEPAAWTGRNVEVQSTPTLVGDHILNLPVRSARQVRVVNAASH